MSKSSDIPAAIQWHEGMMLSPQHFQQLSRRCEELLHYHAQLIAPFHYGVIHVKIDQTLLFDGIVRVLELEAVMPDGLLAVHNKDGKEDLQVSLLPHVEAAKHKPLLVHLVVPESKRAGSIKDGDLARYGSVEGEPILDENTGEQALRIPRLKPRLRLLVTDTPPARYCHMPLLAVQHKNSTWVLDNYIAPALQVTPESALSEICTRVSRRLREKAMYLLEIVRSPSVTTTPVVVEESKRLIHHLVAALPQMEAVLRTGNTHPFVLYTALCSLAGQVAAVGTNLVPPVFPTYDHKAPRRSFEEVSEFIFRTLDEGISEEFASVPFRLDNGTFSLRLERDWLEGPVILGVRGVPGASEQQVMDWIGAAQIGSESKFRSIRDRRVLGVPRKQIERFEGLIATRGMVLFSLSTDSEFIIPNDALMIGNSVERPGQSRPGEILLYVATQKNRKTPPPTPPVRGE